jgi:hypothetical protein
LGLRRGLGGRAPYELEIKCQGRPSDSEGRAEGTDCKLVIYIRRRCRHRNADALEQEKEVSPFTIPHPNPDIVKGSRAQNTTSGLETDAAETMSKSRLRPGISPTQPGMGISHVRQVDDDMDRHQARSGIPNALLVQMRDAIKEELAAALRNQDRPLQEARIMRDSNSEPPPEYSSERGGERTERPVREK